MKSKIKTLIYSDCYLYGGSEKVVYNIINNKIIQEKVQIYFVFRKHHLYLEAVKKDYVSQDHLIKLVPVIILANESIFYNLFLLKIPRIITWLITIPLNLLAKSGFYFLFNFISQCFIIHRIKPELIHINNGGYPAAPSCNVFVLAAKFMGIKNIIYQVNNIASKKKNIFNSLFDKVINRNVRFFITASAQTKEKLSRNRNFLLEKIVVIPNTIVEEEPSLTRSQIISRLNLNESDFLICNVALLSKRKGQKYLLDAIHILKNELPNIFCQLRLFIIGNGEEESFLKSYAKNLAISERIYFLGYRKDYINYISNCDLFVLPSVCDEDMPLAILSAMSQGKAIISTNLGGISEELEYGECGILINNNIDKLAYELANSILYVFRNGDLDIGIKAKQRFYNFYSQKVYGKSILNLYSSLIN